MLCISHIYLELFLYMIILMRGAVASDNDSELEKTLDNKCRKVAEIWNSSCTLDFPHTDSLDNGTGHVSDSSICLFWNISVTVDGEECTTISKSNCFLGGKGKCSLNCQDENAPKNENCKGCCVERIEQGHKCPSCPSEANTSSCETSEQKTYDVNDENENDDDFYGNACKCKTANDDDTDISKYPRQYCKQLKKCMRRKCKEKIDELNCELQGTSSGSNKSSPKQGIFVLTHIVSAAIGAGILYCILFMKKIKRRLNNRNEEERNTGINNASYNLQKGSTENVSVPFFSHHDEGVYCEVAEKQKPRSLPPHNNASLHPFAENVSEGRKNTKLPDIPHQTEKDYNQYLTPISRSLPHEYLNSSGKAIAETYTMDENELRTEDGKIKDYSVLNDVDSLKDTFETETFGQYFVLEKSTDMDLK